MIDLNAICKDKLKFKQQEQKKRMLIQIELINIIVNSIKYNYI